MKLTIKKGSIWSKLKADKRSKYNSKYNKSKEEIKEDDDLYIPSFIEHPLDVTLDQAIHYIEHGPGGETTIVFRKDVIQAEIDKIIELVESEI